MADPATLLAVAAVVKSSQAQAASLESQQNIAEFNARIARQEASAEEERTAFAQRRQAEQARAVAGSLRAQLGASGAVLGAGAPLALEAKQAEESELESLLIGYEGAIAASRIRSEATNLSLQGQLFGRQARQVRQAGAISVGATALASPSSQAFVSAPGRSLLTGFGQR